MTDENQSPEVNEVEEKARAQGWRPDGPKSAEEFLRDGPLYRELTRRGDKIVELENWKKGIEEQLEQQRQLGYKQAVADLERQRRNAIASGDIDTVDLLEAEMKEKQNLYNPPKPKAETPPKEYLDFAERNAYWLNDYSAQGEEIRQYAKQRDAELTQYNLTPAEHVKILENDLKVKFKLEESGSSSSVLTDSATAGKTDSKSKFSVKNLTAEEKKIYDAVPNKEAFLKTIEEARNEK